MAQEKKVFGGMATKYGIKCADGLTLCQGAFDDCDGKRVPLLWNHQHDNPEALMGYAILHKRPDGVYSDCYLNDGPFANATRTALQHGDVWSLSIFANKLKKQGREVVHGIIREVSVVLAGANPEALIDCTSLAHSGMAMDETERADFIGKDVDNFEAYIYHSATDDYGNTVSSPIDIYPEDEAIEHSDKEGKDMAEEKKPVEQNPAPAPKDEKPEGGKERTVTDVYNEMTEEQQKVVNFMVGKAVEEAKAACGSKESEGGKDTMAHGYSAYEQGDEAIKHSVLDREDQAEILKGIKKLGSFQAALQAWEDENSLEHSAMGEIYDNTADSIMHGITNIGNFFPDAKLVRKEPDFIDRRQEWVAKVLGGAKKFPFGRIKSWHADITKDEARAKGYVTGNQKIDEVIENLKRDTTPQTVYKKQSLDRDYILDITDFNVVTWLRGEMRGKLDEECARAILIGDGRSSGSADKISETHIRPIWTDSTPYTISAVETHASNAETDAITRSRLETIIRNKKNFFGTGKPSFFTTEDFLTDCLLMKDTLGHYMYENVEKLCTFLRVDEIVTVPVMANLTRTVTIEGVQHTRTLIGIVVNMADYGVGTDKNGAVTMFDDFDIDLNKEKYLIETRMSGAMITPRAAMILESEVSGN